METCVARTLSEVRAARFQAGEVAESERRVKPRPPEQEHPPRKLATRSPAPHVAVVTNHERFRGRGADRAIQAETGLEHQPDVHVKDADPGVARARIERPGPGEAEVADGDAQQQR